MREIFISPSNNLMFKNLFGVQEREKLVKDFLHKLLELDYNYLEDLEVVNSVKLHKETIENKNLDTNIIIRFKNFDDINLEMQNTYDEDKKIKSLLYMTGSFYKMFKTIEDLKLRKNNVKIQKYFLTNEDDINDKVGENEFCIMTVNFDQSCENSNSGFEAWKKFMTATTEEELYEVAKGNEILEEAYEECIRFMNLDYVQEHARKQQRLEK